MDDEEITHIEVLTLVEVVESFVYGRRIPSLKRFRPRKKQEQLVQLQADVIVRRISMHWIHA